MASANVEKAAKLKRDLASALYRRPVPLVETLNGHARLNRWLKGQTAPSFGHRFELYSHIQATYLAGEPISYLEFGVHKGESFRRWLDIHPHADSRFWGFDTFTGLPTDWGSYLQRGHFDVQGQVPAVDDPRASFRAGLFQQTLPAFLAEFKSDRRLIVHNDSDLYSSTHYTLAKLDELLVPGSIIIFDEFASPLHEFRAWNDYLDAFMRKATLIGTAEPYAVLAAFLFE